MNKIVKHNLGFNIVIGVQGDETFLNEWSNLIHNYDIAADIHNTSEVFFYFVTNKERFIRNFGLFLQNQFFVKKACKAGELRVLGLQEAKKFYDSIEQESFYSF